MHTTTRDTVEEFWDEEALEQCVNDAQHIETGDFLAELASFLGTSGRMWALPSARLALQCFLQSLEVQGKRSVVACSFNCQVVADAIQLAGYEVETFDLADERGRIEWEAIAEMLEPHHAALIVPHLFGVPADFRPVRETAEKMGVLIIEDCAPTLGGLINGTMAGTLGDAAIFSFNYDKPLSLGGGGTLLVSNPKLWSRIVAPQSHVTRDQEICELTGFTEFLRKRRGAIGQPRAALPIRAIRKARRQLLPQKSRALFEVSGIGPLRAALGLWQIKRYPAVLAQRGSNASLFQEDAKCRSWYVESAVIPAWLKQKVIPTSPVEAGRISQQLQEQSLRVGIFNWPTTLDEYLGRPEKPNAHCASRYSLDIPVHQNMKYDELMKIKQAVCSERMIRHLH
jgi:perosamine synthetase